MQTSSDQTKVLLDGNSLTPEVLTYLSSGNHEIDLTDIAWERVRKSAETIEKMVKTDRVIYGINTGFGSFASSNISQKDLSQLQVNLIRSHSAGVGDTMPLNIIRSLLVLRINTLAKGYSGVTEDTLRKFIAAFNKDLLSRVPDQGTVGASGDLAPLAHLALGLIGEGEMWNPKKSIWENASDVLKEHGMEPIHLHPKEGLALINGTQFITAYTAEALVKARKLALTADYVAALSVEALKGTMKAFDSRIHQVRGHVGQNEVAARLRSLLHSDSNPSQIHEKFGKNKLQDAYSLRCIPQVHGVVHDMIEFVRGIIQTEMNSVTDNPLIFDEDVISGGNFHGEYPAKAADMLAIAIAEIGNISERRIERLVNTHLGGHPSYLVKKEKAGLNSGFMIAQYTAAALASENKTLAHPASSDTIPTSEGQEDHVSMGGFAARKCLKVVKNVQHIVAIELLCACQALDFINEKTTPALQKIYQLVRSEIAFLDTDRVISIDIRKAYNIIEDNKIIETIIG